MTTTLRIQPTPPRIPSLESLHAEYQQLTTPSLPAQIYIRRSTVNAMSQREASAMYIPDSLEDRALMQWFLEQSLREVDFYLFRARVKRHGWSKELAVLKAPRSRSKINRSQAKSYLRTAYDQAPKMPAVSFGTFYARVNTLKWTVQKALYTPTNR